jgi:hypothetical protein
MAPRIATMNTGCRTISEIGRPLCARSAADGVGIRTKNRKIREID